MHAEKKRPIEVISTSSKLNIHRTVKDHRQFQRKDNSRLYRQVEHKMNKTLPILNRFNKKNRTVVDQTNLSLQSIDAISTEEFLNTSFEAQENSNIEKYNAPISESNAIRQLGHASLKYKNPYSISISNQNILKEDEPQEGKAKQSILSECRECLANYQESYGTPRTEYSFAALITVMAQAAAQSLWALVYVIVNVVPIIRMFSFILRFVLDKIINIRRTKNFQQIMVKFAIFIVQLLSVCICLALIFDFIVLPITQMTIGIATKLMIY